MAATRRKSEDFYKCYCRFFRAQQRGITKLLGEEFGPIETLKSRQELKEYLAKMSPELRKEYRKMIRGTYKAMVEEGLKLASRYISAFQTDPEVQIRIEKRLKKVLPQP